MTPADYILMLFGALIVVATFDRLWLSVIRTRLMGHVAHPGEYIPMVAWVVSGGAMALAYAVLWVFGG